MSRACVPDSNCASAPGATCFATSPAPYRKFFAPLSRSSLPTWKKSSSHSKRRFVAAGSNAHEAASDTDADGG